MKYPCLYKGLEGTSWYDRLIAAEFDIKLDKYPERETLIDSCLPESLMKGEKWESYRQILLTLKNNRQKEMMNPWDFVARFRTARKELFPDYSIPEDLSENLKRRNTARLKTALQDDRIKKILQTDGEILYIPASRISAPAELKILKKYFPAQNTRVAVSGDSVFDLPYPSDLSAEYEEFPAPEGIEDFPRLLKNEANIICHHSWIMFALLENESDALFIVDENEWFVRNVIGKAKDSNIRISWPGDSGYSQIIETVPIRKDKKNPVYESSILKTGLSPSPVQPKLIDDSQRAKWFTETLSRSSFHHLEHFMIQQNGSWKKCASHTKGAVHCSGLIFPESDALIQPRFFNSMHSPMEMESESLTFMTSFNYFFTDSLKYLYERDGRSCGEWRNFILDYLGIRNERASDYWETVPLYNKAFLGCTESGELKAFHSQSPAIDWTESKNSKNLKRIPLNPEGNPEEALYTAVFSDRAIAHGQTAALVCQDTVMEYGTGPFRIPPFGSVLVTKTELKAGQRITWKVSFPEQKDVNWKWLFGGFNMLIQDQKKLMKDGGKRALKKEGWTSSQSRMTQETQLDPKTRHPRAVIGKTVSGNIVLLVISGRSNLSAGATFEETADLASAISGEDSLDFLVNLDGGASASLTAIQGRNREVLSYTAPSENNPIQIPRPVPALLCITNNRDSDNH